jgi:predicted 3-demethylubiquinone-9 3-methyltransferase (glyoxalase superfamily)
MQKIVPHLWFDKEAKAAADFYASAFPNSKVNSVSTLKGTPSGDTDIVSFTINGFEFQSISAGPYFKLNPSISFFVNFDPSQDPQVREHLSALWSKLSEGGKVLMPLQEYPFSKWYGWIEDRFGVSWQLILTNPEGESRPFIVPSFLFVGDVCGKAEEAMKFYQSVFTNSKQGLIARYPAGREPDKEGTIMFTDFKLEDVWLAAMDSAHKHAFGFNEAVSLIVRCANQQEIDYYWEKLSADPKAEQCGWLKDKFGISWQITPIEMDEMMSRGTPEQVARLTESFLKMKKFDLAELKKVYNG